MLILFNHDPAPLRSFLPHLGWDTLNTGELMRAAEQAAFEVFLTTDKNIRYQQNLAQRIIAIVVLRNSRWPLVLQIPACTLSSLSGIGSISSWTSLSEQIESLLGNGRGR